MHAIELHDMTGKPAKSVYQHNLSGIVDSALRGGAAQVYTYPIYTLYTLYPIYIIHTLYVYLIHTLHTLYTLYTLYTYPIYPICMPYIPYIYSNCICIAIVYVYNMHVDTAIHYILYCIHYACGHCNAVVYYST
jgi:hypothetical protein